MWKYRIKLLVNRLYGKAVQRRRVIDVNYLYPTPSAYIDTASGGENKSTCTGGKVKLHSLYGEHGKTKHCKGICLWCKYKHTCRRDRKHENV